MNPQDCFIGLDVSKDTLEVAVRPTEERKTFANQEDGLSLLIDFVKPFSPRLIVLEATGGLEKAAVCALAVAGLPVVVVNPRQVRDFAKAKGILAKTDKIDAGVIAQFGEAIRPEIRPLKAEEAQKLDALLSRRRSGLEKTSKNTSLGWRKILTSSTRIWTGWLRRARFGGRRMRSSRASKEWDPSSP
jgi:transposase